MDKLTDDELWEKCKNGGPITVRDLGIRGISSSDEPFYFTEGIKEVKYDEYKG